KSKSRKNGSTSTEAKRRVPGIESIDCHREGSTMPLELIEDAKGDPRNARFLALASALAYLPEAEGAQAYHTELGLEARLISVGNTQVYVATKDDHIVVAFRGTESPTSIEGLKDWLLTDAANMLIQPQGDLGTDFAAAGVAVRWHDGFMRALA